MILLWFRIPNREQGQHRGLKISKNVICIRWSSNTSFSPWKCFHHDTFIHSSFKVWRSLLEKMRSYRCRIWGIFQLLTSKCKYYKSTILPFPSTKVMQNASEVEDIQLFLRAQHMCNNSNWVKYGLLPYALYKCEK